MLGELAQLSCVHEYEKTYWVMVEDDPASEKLAQLEGGISLKGYFTLPAKARIISEPSLPPRSKPVTPHGPTAWIEIKLREGKKRQIRQMTGAVGLPHCGSCVWRLVTFHWGISSPANGET
jgi:23S rRNA pseudouridine2457 synthase